MDRGKSNLYANQMRQAAHVLTRVLEEGDSELDWQSLFALAETLEAASETLVAFPEEITGLAGYSSQAATQAGNIDGVASALKTLAETIRLA